MNSPVGMISKHTQDGICSVTMSSTTLLAGRQDFPEMQHPRLTGILKLHETTHSIPDCSLVLHGHSTRIVQKSNGRRRTTWERMTQPVVRLYNMVTVTQSAIDAGQVAINPDTGLPYIFRHVDSNAVGLMDGTFENPVLTIPTAQAIPGDYDIVYVHAGSQFTGVDSAITAITNTSILGEISLDSSGNAIMHEIDVQGLGRIPIPGSGNGSTIKPILDLAPLDAVTFESNSQFSGFTINDPGRHGMVADSINSAISRYVDINRAGDKGLLLNGNSGSFTFSNLNINLPVGNALEVTGGNAQINIDNSNIINTANRAVLIDGITGGVVNMDANSTIMDTNGTGIFINNTAGAVTIGNANIQGSLSTGIDVQNTIGSVNFNGQITIDRPTGIAFNIQDTLAGSSVLVGGVAGNTLDITNRVLTGINLERIAGNVSFNNPTTISGHVLSNGFPAINFQESSGSVLFTTLDIVTSNDDGAGNGGIGIDIGNTVTENTGFIHSQWISQYLWNDGYCILGRGRFSRPVHQCPHYQ